MIILASGSARRRDYLAQLGASFEVIPADIDESAAAGETAEALALRLAREKASAVRGASVDGSPPTFEVRKGKWILAADTVVAVEEEILGKPRDRDDAARMLRLLAGREHRVVTGVVLLAPDGTAEIDEAVVTLVRFRPLGDDEIAAYVAGGEADDKAGAYGIQGAAAAFVERVEGSFSNVVGLPLEVVEPALRRRDLLAGHPPARR